MAASKKIDIPVIPVRKGESMKSIYAKLRKAFTAEELARFAEPAQDDDIPMEQLIAELQAIQAKSDMKRTPTPAKRTRNGRTK